MTQDAKKDTHIIDTRFTFSGPRAKEFLDLVKEEYGTPIPYGGIRQLIRLACIYYLEVRRKTKDNDSGK